MQITKEWVKAHTTPTDYQRGQAYFLEKRVFFFREHVDHGETHVACCVQGHDPYDVTLSLISSKRERSRSFQARCNCLRFAEAGTCKHIVAALLEYERHHHDDSEEDSEQSDRRARQLLRHYLTPPTAEVQAPVRLIPTLILPITDGAYPAVSFRIGQERLYVVRNLDSFLTQLLRQETVTYGKGLTLRHDIALFDPPAQQLISLLLNQYYSRQSQMRYLYGSVHTGNQTTFAGADFDHFFDLFTGQSLFVDKQNTIRLLDETPQLHVQVEQENQTFQFRRKETFLCFGDLQQLYLLLGDTLYRCDDTFRTQVFPFLSAIVSPIRIAKDDMPAFCSCVLPTLGEHICFEGDTRAFSQFLPDEPVVQYYFDWAEDTLTCKLQFQYGEATLHAPIDPTLTLPDVKRNMREELEKASRLQPYFHPPEAEVYMQDDPDRIYAFLTDGLPQLAQEGEVYVTDKLSRMQLSKPSVKVGLSLSNGILRLDIDTGEVPREELSALFASLKQKKTYHRLQDGRFLCLDETGFPQLAELSTMLQCNPKELQTGTISLPAFRVPYVDAILRGSKDLSVTRSLAFKELIRSFQGVEDSAFPLPDAFESILRPYQKTGFRWLKTLDAHGFGGILADDMGLGKTVQVLSYLVSLQQEGQTAPALIVCPASLILNWGEEAGRFAPTLKLALVMGDAAERKNLLDRAADFNVLVTSYDLLRRDVAQYQEKIFYVCILDEAQFMKNQSTQASKAVKSIQAEHRFALTGTPIENRLSELWNIFDFLMPGYLYTHNTFVSKLEKPILKEGKPESRANLAKLVQPFLLRRMKAQVLQDLPPKTEHVHKLQMESKQRKVYLAAVAHAKTSLAAAGTHDKMKIFAALTQLRQICCDPRLCFEEYNGESCKLNACIELCRTAVGNGHRILLFSQFTSMLNLIRVRLEEEQITHFTLQGSTPKQKRAQMVKDFNHGAVDVFLISLKAGGTGLNLTSADIVIHYDPWWNIAAQNQATDRAHRIGQTAHVQVYQLIAKDSIEEKILDLQARKKELMDSITGESNGEILSMDKEEILALLES